MENINLLAVIPFENADFLFTIAFITLCIGVIGLVTKYKIFLIFSIGGIVTLIPEFVDYPAIVISLIGVIIFNLWFATIGSRTGG